MRYPQAKQAQSLYARPSLHLTSHFSGSAAISAQSSTAISEKHRAASPTAPQAPTELARANNVCYWHWYFIHVSIYIPIYNSIMDRICDPSASHKNVEY